MAWYDSRYYFCHLRLLICQKRYLIIEKPLVVTPLLLLSQIGLPAQPV